jgi:hypothetical protein
MRIIHTDKVTVDCDPKMFQERVLRRPHEEYHPDCVHEGHYQGGKSVTFWAASCSEYHTDLIVVPSGMKMNSLKYVRKILNPYL